MRTFIDSMRDTWCLVSSKCRPRYKHDPYIAWMREQEHAATQSAADIRQRRVNIIEEQLLGERKEDTRHEQ